MKAREINFQMALCDFCTLLRVLILSQKSNNNFIFTGASYS